MIDIKVLTITERGNNGLEFSFLTHKPGPGPAVQSYLATIFKYWHPGQSIKMRWVWTKLQQGAVLLQQSSVFTRQ